MTLMVAGNNLEKKIAGLTSLNEIKSFRHNKAVCHQGRIKA